MNDDTQAARLEVLIDRLERVLDSCVGGETAVMSEEQVARARAEHNRDNAELLYGDVLEIKMVNETAGYWVVRETQNAVVFTQYGWRDASAVEEETGRVL